MSELENSKTKSFHCDTLDDIQNSRILIVDDNEPVRNFLFKALKAKNYEIELAESFKEALEKLSLLHFDLLLTDINLPDRSGEELLVFSKNSYKSTEVILITGDPHLDGAVRDIKKGAFDYLAKPIAVELLYERVEAALVQSKTKQNISVNTEDTLSDTGYSVVRTLGSGNMGVVLLVEKDKKYYAMKILRRETKDPLSDLKVKRFIREAEILSKIDHPNIVKVIEYGMSGREGVPFFVMEFISSLPLNHYIAQNSLTIDQKISIIRDSALALNVVHNEGILHRDIKPGNILITDKNQVKLTDFGIARVSDSSITIPSEILGSPAYMSPEAFDSSVIKDQRSDIFSLGTIAYELLTGQKPFNGDTIGEVMNEIRFNRPIEPMKIVPDLPPYLQDILAKMLAKKPEDRFSSVDKVVHALDHQSGNLPHKEGITSRLLRTLILRKPTWK
jgi:FixJ family two-component response regulator